MPILMTMMYKSERKYQHVDIGFLDKSQILIDCESDLLLRNRLGGPQYSSLRSRIKRFIAHAMLIQNGNNVLWNYVQWRFHPFVQYWG
jgi:hypothetical protein